MGDDARVYSGADLGERLGGLPGWSAGEDGHDIRRTYATSGWKATLMVVNAVGYLAEAAWHHPDITAGYGSVEVRLTSHDAGGVTDRDLALARRIDEVVGWRPGDEPGPLSGPPADSAPLKPG